MSTGTPVGSWSIVPCTIPTAAPSARAGHTCVMYKDCLYVFGGYDGKRRMNDLHKFSFADQRWTVVSASGLMPTPRSRHTSVVYKDAMYVFGGFDGNECLNDFMEYNFVTGQWSRVKVNVGNAPSPREYHAAVVYDTSMFCFGGRYCYNEYGYFTQIRTRSIDDYFHEFNFVTGTWSLVRASGCLPGPRSLASLVVFEHSCLLFGGDCDRRSTNDVHVFDFVLREWSPLETTGSVPCPRTAHVAVIHSSTMYVFGGFDRCPINDFYKLTINLSGRSTWQVVASQGSTPRQNSDHVAAVFDSSLVVFGGYDGRNWFNDFSQFRIGENANRPVSFFSDDDEDDDEDKYADELNRLSLEPRRDKVLQGSAASVPSRVRDPHLVQLCSCPISMDIMADPVLTPSGITYERAMIEQHLDRVGAFDPTTKTPLTKRDLYPNRAIKDLIERHLPDHDR